MIIIIFEFGILPDYGKSTIPIDPILKAWNSKYIYIIKQLLHCITKKNSYITIRIIILYKCNIYCCGIRRICFMLLQFFIIFIGKKQYLQYVLAKCWNWSIIILYIYWKFTFYIWKYCIPNENTEMYNIFGTYGSRM